MLEKMLKLYTTSLAGDVRSPMPHLIGPPGCGKSLVAQQMAELLHVNLHIVNVSRLSPLELEGVQMPETIDEKMVLRLLHSTMWTQLKDGDIILFDEFLRGFPEVYNGLLDIFTSREVAGFKLPKVFIMGASNSSIAYDGALEDRLMHLPVNDPRNNRSHSAALANVLVEEIGLMPDMVKSQEMNDLLVNVVYPMFEVLDQFKGKGVAVGTAQSKGKSIRNLIGQAKMREVQTNELDVLISMNNSRAMTANKPQYVVLLNGRQAPHSYETAARRLKGNEKLTAIQAVNLNLNLQFIELEATRQEEKGITDDAADDSIFTN